MTKGNIWLAHSVNGPVAAARAVLLVIFPGNPPARHGSSDDVRRYRALLASIQGEAGPHPAGE
jgi:hypothetical protein